MKKIVVIVLLFLLLNNAAKAQKSNSEPLVAPKPFVLGKVEEIWSSQLSEKRVLNIYLPEGYDKDINKAYPVIYLLDGSADEDFIHIVGLVQFLTMIDTMPPSIIVGIANVDRKRDFTFPTTVAKDKKDYPTTGGSEKFISFIEKDLEPYIEQQYRINGSKRTIIGQSLGGLLATQVLLQKPDLFDNFIVVSPSLWWDNESLLQKARGLLNASAFHRTTVYVAVGDEEKVMEDDAKKLVEILQHPLSPELRVFYVSEPKENHLTILHNAVYNAIEKLELKKY